MDRRSLRAADAMDSGSGTHTPSPQQGLGRRLLFVLGGPQRYSYAKFKQH
jgi:hypothetical protein